MAINDWNGFKKGGDTFIPNDSTSRTAIGTLTNLLTTAKNNLVAAINELFTNKVSWDDATNYVGKNLLDISKILNLYMDITNSKYVEQTSPNVCVAKVKPNTEYIITKQAGTSFRVASSPNYPANNVAYTSTYADHTGTEIRFTTGANDHYLGVFTSGGDFPTCMVRLASVADST